MTARVRKVSMLDVARAAGVSKNAVSLAMRNDPQIPRATRMRITKIAEKLGYAKNPTVGHLMAELRRGTAHAHRATLALINAHQERDAFRIHPTIPDYVKGCQRAAQQRGYSLDEFWLHDPELSGERLVRIMRARRIRGAVIVGLMNRNQLPGHFEALWANFPCVVTGVRTRQPALSFACVDHHILALRAFEGAMQLGYRRPALVLDEVIDHLVEGRFSAGVLIAQQSLPKRSRTNPFYKVREARRDRELFRKWLDREKPDVLLTLYHEVFSWVEQTGLKVPQDIGLIQLEWREQHSSWTGMHQHNDIVGEAAVGMVVEMIHSGEIGAPSFPRATLVGSTWIPGLTTRSVASAPSARQTAWNKPLCSQT